MNFIVAATIFSLSVITLNCVSVMGAKEEPEEGMLTHRFSPNGMRGHVQDVMAVIEPEEPNPLCPNIEAVYDRLLKRGPTFNAWGGKKRANRIALLRQFGKRNPSSQFNPWGGKRGDTDDYSLNSEDKIGIGGV